MKAQINICFYLEFLFRETLRSSVIKLFALVKSFGLPPKKVYIYIYKLLIQV